MHFIEGSPPNRSLVTANLPRAMSKAKRRSADPAVPSSPTKRQRLLSAGGRESQDNSKRWKLFNDPIHGPIELHPLLIKIIDTPQFQRLRDIKQLSTVHYVYYGATHSRFEHSIGTCYLAGKLIKTLKKKQPELCIDDKDVLCVQIAGLCHDLGHGPYSHMYQDDFIPRTRKWKHEDCSLTMFDHLMEKNNMEALFQEYGLDETSINIIRVQIGPTSKIEAEIIANKKNGVDVDKWDYIARDSYYLGLSSSFDHRRIMKLIRVIDGELCVRDKGMSSLYEMYSMRNSLHQKAYKHKTTRIVSLMVAEAMSLADDIVCLADVEGTEGTKMSEAIDNMSAYTNLTDHILHQISLHVSDDARLKKSKELLQRIKYRDFYKFVGELNQALSEEVSNGRKDKITKMFVQDLEGVEASDILVDIVIFDHGYNGRNPLENIKVYTKESPNCSKKITSDQVSIMLPENSKEVKIRFYCRSKQNECLEACKRRYMEWLQKSYTKGDDRFVEQLMKI